MPAAIGRMSAHRWASRWKGLGKKKRATFLGLTYCRKAESGFFNLCFFVRLYLSALPPSTYKTNCWRLGQGGGVEIIEIRVVE